MRRNIVPSHFTLNPTPNQEHKAFLSANARRKKNKEHSSAARVGIQVEMSPKALLLYSELPMKTVNKHNLFLLIFLIFIFQPIFTTPNLDLVHLEWCMAQMSTPFSLPPH